MQLIIFPLTFLFFYPYLNSLLGGSLILSALIVIINIYLLTFCANIVLNKKWLIFNLSFFILFAFILFRSVTPLYSAFSTFRGYYLPLLLFINFLTSGSLVFKIKNISNLAFTLFVLILGFQVSEILSLYLFPSILPLFQPSNEVLIFSRPIGILQDYQSVPFIIGLFSFYYFCIKRYKIFFFLSLLLIFSGLRTHMFASILVCLLYLIVRSIQTLISSYRIKRSIFFVFVFLIVFVLMFALPILTHQITSNNSSLSLIINYFVKDSSSYVNYISLFGTGVHDYSSETLASVLPSEVLRNEIGFVRMLFELGLIPTVVIFMTLMKLFYWIVPIDKTVSSFLFIYILLGLLHHITVFNPICIFYLAFILSILAYYYPVHQIK